VAAMTGTIKIWNLRTGKLLHTLDGHADAVKLHHQPHTTIFSSVVVDNPLRWNLED